MRLGLLTAILATSVALPTLASAAVHYVRVDATGSGTGADWANAWTSLPTTLVRGDTYYVADGSYGSIRFNAPLSGSSVITIVKATVADHGSATGWLDSYGDGTATFSQWAFYTGYYNLDGRVGGGPASWSDGHGFAVALTSNSGAKLVTINANNITDVTIQHTRFSYEFNRALTYRSTSVAAGQDVVYNASYNGMVDWTFRYCYFERPGRTHFLTRGNGHSNWLLEYSMLEKSGHGNPAQHSEMWSHFQGLQSTATNTVTDVTIRYNYILDWVSTGGFMFAGGTNIQVYGNVFRWSSDWGATSQHGACSNWSSPYGNTSWKIYNNTFIDLGAVAGRLGFGGASSGVAYNNVWWNSTPGIYGLSHDHNWFQGTSAQGEANGEASTTDPFVDSAAGDVHLAAPTQAGTTLSAPYDTDMDGAARAGDGTWDRGAYEYGGTVSSCGASAGECCGAGELCEGGLFGASSDCGTRCCVGGGRCQLPVATCKSQGYSCCALCGSGPEPALDSDCGGGVCCAACGAGLFNPEVCIEAEYGEIVAPLAVGDDAGASAGGFVAAPIAEQGVVHFTFDVVEAGDYALQARVQTPGLTHDSFYVGYGGTAVQGVVEQVYDAALSATFVWDRVSLRGPGGTPEVATYDPMIWQLAPGQHVFSFWGREEGARLDQVVLRLCAPGSGCIGLTDPDCSGTLPADDAGPQDDGAGAGDNDFVEPLGGDPGQVATLPPAGCGCRAQSPAVLAGWLVALLFARRPRRRAVLTAGTCSSSRS